MLLPSPMGLTYCMALSSPVIRTQVLLENEAHLSFSANVKGAR